MVRKLGWVLMLAVLALPAAASSVSGSIAGYVKNSAGVPQMGAVVEVLSASPLVLATAFTNVDGRYSIDGLAAGIYRVRVSAPSFLPAMREEVVLTPGSAAVVNITLNTLFEAMQMMPLGGRSNNDEDGWKWNLRNMANKPVLRFTEDDGSLVMVSKSEDESDRVLKARVAFLAGSDMEGFGGAGGTTSFGLERSMFSAGTLSLDGSVGYGEGLPATVLRARYSHRRRDGSEPSITVTARRLTSPDKATHDTPLDALAVSVADTMNFANLVGLSVGSEFQTIQFLNQVSALRPFGSVDVHLSPDTVFEYRYATTAGSTRSEKGFDSAPADLSESGPRVSLTNGRMLIERSHHHEISLSQRVGGNSFQVAVFKDSISNPALTGVGEVPSGTGDYLSDVYSGTFTYTGQDLNTTGVRFVAQRKLTSNLTATLDYAYGGVLTLGNHDMAWGTDASAMMRTERQHALACKLAGTLPRWKTSWIASYKWSSGPALTPVDMFNTSPGLADAYFNIFLRQPVPGTGFMPGRMEALVDIRNLLAQGYEPLMGQDGRTVYLVQSARAIRGGVAFIF